MQALSSRSGLTLLELLLAGAIALIGAMAVLQLYSMYSRLNFQSQRMLNRNELILSFQSMFRGDVLLAGTPAIDADGLGVLLPQIVNGATVNLTYDTQCRSVDAAQTALWPAGAAASIVQTMAATCPTLTCPADQVPMIVRNAGGGTATFFPAEGNPGDALPTAAAICAENFVFLSRNYLAINLLVATEVANGQFFTVRIPIFPKNMSAFVSGGSVQMVR
jgi:type II secretory pathway pseudopilin PulG